MSGYTLKIATTLIVDNKDPNAMADAAALIADLPTKLKEFGFNTAHVEATYRPKLKAGAVG